MSSEHADVIRKRAVKIEAKEVANRVEDSSDTCKMSEEVNTPTEYFDCHVIKLQREHQDASVDPVHSSAGALITEECAFKIKQEEVFNHVQDLNDTCQNSDKFNTTAVCSNSCSIKMQCKQLETSAGETRSVAKKITTMPKSVTAIKLEVRMEYGNEVNDDVQRPKGGTNISEAAFNSDPCNLPSIKLESAELEVNNSSPTSEANNSDLIGPKSETSTVKQNGLNSSESCQTNNSVNCSDKANAENASAIYTCIFCKKRYEIQASLSLHLSSHYRERPYRCAHCEYAYKSKKGLIAHLPVHWNKKWYTCSTCNKSFKRSSSLLVHRLRHSNKKPHVCTVCGKRFRVKIDLTNHVASRCAERPYTCSLCKKTFKTKQTFLRHRLCHTNKRPFTCNECGKSFKARPHLKEHFESHSDERPHRCESCGMEFKNKSVLDTHIQRIHIKVRQFSCPTCNKSFVKHYELTRHTQLHNAEKSFLCSHCNKAFSAERYLMAHLSRVSAKKSFRCRNCNRGFKTKYELASHVKCCNKTFKAKHKHLKGNLLCPSNQSVLESTRTSSEMPLDDADRRFRGRTYSRVPRHKQIEALSDKNHLPERDLEGNLLCSSNQSTLERTRTIDEILTSATRNTKLIVETNTGQESHNSIVRIVKITTPSDNTNRKFQGRTYTRLPL